MNNYQQPSGLTIGLGFLIDDNWTAEQAWAVVELLDDLRGANHEPLSATHPRVTAGRTWHDRRSTRRAIKYG